MNWLANKRRLSVLVIAVVITGGTLTYKLISGSAPESILATGENGLETGQDNLLANEPDRDSDGLLDWQETLWHTDPEKKDTDGDGTNDGTEVDLGRDPVKKGPGDALEKAEPPTAPENGAYAYSFDETLGEGLTGRIGVNLAYNYLASISSGGPENTDVLVNNILQQVESPTIYRDISLSDLNIVSDELDNGAIYLEAVDLVISKIEGSPYDDIDTVVLAIRTGDVELLSSLDTQLREYRKTKRELLELPVPAYFASLHLRALRAIDTLIRSLEAMRYSNNDPILVLQEISRYQFAIEEIATAYNQGALLADRYLN